MRRLFFFFLGGAAFLGIAIDSSTTNRTITYKHSENSRRESIGIFMNVQAVISDARHVFIPHIMNIRQDIRMDITIVKRPLASFDSSQDMD